MSSWTMRILPERPIDHPTPMKPYITTGRSGLSVVFLGSWQRTEEAIQQLLHNFRGLKPPRQTTFTNESLQRVVGRRIVSPQCQQILRNSRCSVRAVPTIFSSLQLTEGKRRKQARQRRGSELQTCFSVV